MGVHLNLVLFAEPVRVAVMVGVGQENPDGFAERFQFLDHFRIRLQRIHKDDSLGRSERVTIEIGLPLGVKAGPAVEISRDCAQFRRWFQIHKRPLNQAPVSALLLPSVTRPA